ncbi:MAG: DUF4125 family protein [Oscillospiraceae bacterium]|nr:DUF4125 family protein [Oscillospiraceae bacterium]
MNTALIDEIIKTEWDMFQKVNEGGPRADCQDDPDTFDGMRRGQFMAWSEEALQSYRLDLLNAGLTGRNLVMEKYINMMKFTNPEDYKKLEGLLTFPSQKGIEDAEYVAWQMVRQTIPLHEKYPYVSGAGRPLYATDDYKGTISIQTYQRGELLTYSDKTLALLRAHLDALSAKGESLARNILENSVMHYGYDSLDDAETRIRRRMEMYYPADESGFDCGGDCGDCGGGCDCCG